MADRFPLVSIVVPAYKITYLTRTLRSVLEQTYPALEIVICDDGTSVYVAEIADTVQADTTIPVRYFKNESSLGEYGSTARGIRLAQGKYIKLLHDDDMLEPDCIAELVAAFENEANVTLASSRRQRIDGDGEPLPDILPTCFPFSGDVLIDGKELVSFLGDHTINFIGEPSCILARRDDLLAIADELMSLNGTLIHWVGDLALYAKLLQRGNLAFLAKPLTKFRVSSAQFSQVGRDQVGIGDKGHADFRKAIRDLGWYRTSGDNKLVGVAPITQLKARVFKPVNLLAALHRAAGLGSVSLANWMGIRRPTTVQQGLIDQHLAAQQGGPRIAVMLLDRAGSAEAIENTLSSLQEGNLYRNLEIWVLSPLTLPDLAVKAKVVALDPGGNSAIAINGAIAETQAEWVLLAEAGSDFMPSGLLIAALDLPTLPASCHAAYADDIIRLEDNELGLNLRPDLNLDLLLSFPASMSPHWLFRRTSLIEQGGFSATSGRAFELEYQLRLIEQLGLGSIAHISEPLLIGQQLDLQAYPEEQAVIAQHLAARGYEQPVVHSHLPRCYAIDYGHAQQPSVSILVIVKDRLPQVQRCLETLLEHTSYPNYEVLLLDHGNQAADIRNWLAGIESMALPQLRVLRFDAGIAREALCNQAAQHAHGDFLLWLGDGAGILNQDWLQQLLNHGLRPEVGAVGGKLLSADGKIRHAGLLLGLNGPAGRAFEGLSHDEGGYMQRLQVDQQYSALSRECLLLRRELFLQAGGFDEDPLLSRWCDADLCLKLQQAGFLNVWTPRVTLLMDMPAAAAASAREEDAMYARWLPVLARDPAYNPGFSVKAEPGFKLAEPSLSWRPLQAWKPLPAILAHHADPYGCGHYRVIQPLIAMRAAALIDGTISGDLLSPVELERYQPDAVVLQRQTTEDRVEAIRRIKAFSQAFKVYELDDYLPNLPMKSMYRKHVTKDAVKALRQGLGFVDRFVVSTPALAEAFAGLHADIRVVKNRLPVSWWKDLQTLRRTAAKPRVGWAGGNSHTGDLELIADVVKELADEVEWVFFGMCPEMLRPYVHEFHGGVAIDKYPSALAGLNLDLALAPVEQNLFNECKSNLRLLEYGACGFPVICSDIRCYQEDNLPVTRVKNRFRDWVDAIRTHIADLDAAAEAGDALRQEVLSNWMLEGEHLYHWRRAWLPDGD
ncbi:glycosyltransferase [Methylobacillus flagellatus]|uniref:glycosyltransferase n=1 Tax=Methylobacillus flagellatus TaxID=405 RepID=UPI002853B48C|nr:glycosyltransferase [Methylobacillus flagellatus]MDR5172037.1 glycosyltransferase [Methylobacillus flagellatus]